MVRGRSLAVTLFARQGSRHKTGPRTLAQQWVDSIPDGVAMTNQDRRIGYANKKLSDMFGYELGEIIGLSPSDLLTKESDLAARRHRKGLQSPDQSRPSGLVTLVGVKKDGSHFPIQICMTTNVIGKQKFTASIVRDISDQVALDKELERRKGFLETVLNTMLDAVVVMDTSGKILECSEATLNMFEYSIEELINQPVNMLMSCEDAPHHDQYLTNYLKSGHRKILGGEPREVLGQTKSAKILSLELAVNEMSIGGERLFVGVLRDVSSRKLLESEMQKSQRLKALGSLAAGVAHNFNNILTPVMALSETMLTTGNPDERSRKRLTVIHQASLRGQSLIAEIMKYGDDEDKAGKENLDLRELIFETLKLIRHGLPANIEIKTCINSEPIFTYGDASAIQSILLNILQNAVGAMGQEAGQILVSARFHQAEQQERIGVFTIQPGTYVCIAMADTGPGMVAAILDRIFEPFFTTREPGLGTGLGLSTAATIIEAHGGAIHAKSEPGEGATFTMYFPCSNDLPALCDDHISKDQGKREFLEKDVG